MPIVETGGDDERDDAFSSAAQIASVSTVNAPLLQHAVMSVAAASVVHKRIALIPHAMAQTAKKVAVAFHRARPEPLQLEMKMTSKQQQAVKKRLSQENEHELASSCRAASHYAQARHMLKRTIEEEEVGIAELESDIETLRHTMAKLEARDPQSLLEPHRLCLCNLEAQLADCRNENEQRKRVTKLFEKAEIRLYETIGALVAELDVDSGLRL